MTAQPGRPLWKTAEPQNICFLVFLCVFCIPRGTNPLVFTCSHVFLGVFVRILTHLGYAFVKNFVFSRVFYIPRGTKPHVSTCFQVFFGVFVYILSCTELRVFSCFHARPYRYTCTSKFTSKHSPLHSFLTFAHICFANSARITVRYAILHPENARSIFHQLLISPDGIQTEQATQNHNGQTPLLIYPPIRI